MLDIAIILICVGLLAKALGAMARDSRIDKLGMRRALAFAAIFVPGMALLAVMASYLPAGVTQSRAMLQLILLAPVMIALLALESFRWMPRIEGQSWHPGRLFRAFEVALPVLAVVLVVWAISDPVTRL